MAADPTYVPKVSMRTGGDKMVVASGGSIEVESGGSIDDSAVATDDALSNLRVARATFDFAVDGGTATAHGLGVTIPDNAIIVGGFYDVITTFTSPTTDDATLAIHVEGANDIVNAVAIDTGTPWDAGQQAIIPKANTPESTGVKTSAAREITVTIGVEAITAGKLVIWLYYVVSD